MVIDFFNINGGGSGGTVDYATSANTSNKTKLLEGVSSLPQDANEGDVIAGANTPTSGGAKSRSAGIETALYQYHNGDWEKVEMGGGSAPDFTSLKPVDEFPSSAKTGEVVAISSVNSVYDSVIIPSKTLAFEGNDVLTITTEYGTLTVNTYEKDGYNTIYFETDDAQGSDILAEDGQSTTLPTNDENHIWAMEYDGDVYIRITENKSPVYVFTTESLTDNTCFAYLGGNHEEIETLGLYQYDGSDWNQVGETEAPAFLKSQPVEPEGVELGDVYALAYDSYSFEQTGAFVNNNHYNVTWDSNPPQAILTATQSFVADDTRMTIYLNKNGEEWKNFTATYTSGGIETDVDFIVPNPEGELIVYDGETPVAVLTLTEGGIMFLAFIVDSDYSFYRASNDSLFNIFSSEYAFTATTQTHVYQVVDDGEGGLTTVELATKNDIPSGSTYELPIASSQTLGGVKVGNNLTIDSGGTLSTSGLVVGSGITTIVKIYQSDYDALVSGGTADSSTLYVVLTDPQRVIVITNMSTSISGEDKKVSFFDGDLYVDIINNAVADSGNTTQSAFTVSYDDNQGELVFTGDFPLSGVGIRFDLYDASGQTVYDTCSGDDTLAFSGFTASTAFDVNCVHDYQAECEANYGCWDGENCLYNGDQGFDECDCESGGGSWVDGYGCDYECSGDLECLCSYQGGCWDSENQTCLFSVDQGYDECDCVAQGGTWDGSECQYGGGSSDPDYCNSESADYDQDACNCVSDGGSWEDDGNGGYVCVGYTNEECNAGGSDYNLGACECIHNGGTWIEGAEPSDSYCDYGAPDYCDEYGPDYNPDACACETAGGEWEDDGEGNYYCECNGDPGCECAAAGGSWDDMMGSCDCDGDGRCECLQNGGEWVTPEIGDPYCHNFCDPNSPAYDETICNCISNGGEWVDDGEGGGYCECFVEEYDNECSCVTNGGSWEYNEDSGEMECKYTDYCDSEASEYDSDACNCVMSGGEWLDDGEGNYYCDCQGNLDCDCAMGNLGPDICECMGGDSSMYDECECTTLGGTWDGSDCTYPE